MKHIFSFVCATCGRLHEGSPSIGYSAPFYWQEAYRADTTGTSRINDDLCMIERRDYFIRCILEVPILEVEEPFLWGVWVSQSERNFQDYADSFHDTPERRTFGYFANRLPGYPDTLSLHTQVNWQRGRGRPIVELEPADHPLYRDWSEGIGWARAAELARPYLHPDD
ncbi:MAG TPA: DUF2199 domain-containing protein [Dongiaceae bacterium]|jgi:hypothetical protein|nr:DUF2199 domain-containing protein [Dongiaceae bacterium]HSE73276.1 DUF2199 domain-containing protein [Dongiaceae bacterium]